jgi:hypothetical protein
VNRPPHEHETKQPATSSQQYTFFDEKRDPLIDGGGGGESKACSVLTSTLDTSTACVRKLVFLSLSFWVIANASGRAAENSEIGWVGVSAGKTWISTYNSTHHRDFLPPEQGREH